MNANLLVSLVCLALLAEHAIAQELEATMWEPKEALVFAVGVLEFEDAKAFSSYPQKGRRDSELIAWFKKRGTPVERIRYLQDAQATLKASREALSAHLRLSRPGDFLVFYYTGHGSRQANGATYVVPRDCRADAMQTTGWGVAEILDTIQKGFKGERVLLIADCCYSGAFGREAAKRPGRISWGCLSSSLASTPSTGNWTFTESLLAGLRGEARTDANGNGVIRLDELASFIEQELAFVDGQLSSYSVTGSFPRDLLLAKVLGRKEPRFGERLLVSWKGDWFKAHVLKAKGDEVYVHFPGWGAEWDEWVGPDRILPYEPKQFAKGTSVQVEWKGAWWPAEVLDARLGMHHIHYDGYSAVWDEWVSPKRIRTRDN